MSKGLRSVRYNAELACDQLALAEPRLAKLIALAGPFTMQLKSSHSPFEALMESIVYQQLHGRAASAILKRLLALFGEIQPQPEQILAVPDELLRRAGLSANKALALRDLAAKTIDGTVPTLAKIRRLSDVEIVDRLTQVRGIGPWTVEMLLMFRLGRPDILPSSDYGVRRGFALTFGKLPKGEVLTPAMFPTPAELLRRGEKWRPWRSVASWYLWRACDLADVKPPMTALPDAKKRS